jgi:DNA-directed RNA polymerase subunit M/transcription elongation factor TFIIS
VVDIELNVLGIEPTIDEKNDKKIEITNKMGFVMKFPSLKMLRGFSSTNEVDAILDMTVSCIDYIYDDEKIYYAKDSTKEELVDFVESLMTKDLEKIKNFFDTMPKIKKDVEFKCNKCGHEETIQIEGIESFFV